MKGRTLREVLARKRELASRAAAQRAGLVRHAENLSGPLLWVDRGLALAVALRRGAGFFAAITGFRALFTRR